VAVPVRTRTPAPPEAPTRVARAAARERKRRLTAGLVAISLAGAAAAWLLLPGGGSDPAGPAAGSDEPARAGGRASTVAISLRGAAEPLMAIVRTGGEVAPILSIPPDMALEIPGLGLGTSATIADQDAEGMRVSLSNLAGTWIDHYLTLDMNGIATLADAAGGFAVTLPGTATLPTRSAGPGAVTLSGEEVRAYLAIDGPNAFTRWEIVLPALLQARTGGLTGESDDLEAVTRLLPVAGDVRIETFPTRISTSSARVPDLDSLDRLMAADFEVARPPVDVLVQNGIGDPGIGSDVAARIVPRGFRIVFSSNADSFDVRTTQIVAVGDQHVGDANSVRRALGVGEVGVTQVPSGLADITIVIGKDFTA
jgi:hypothetical protein